MSVREIAAEIVAREGGFANDPDDPGGATKYGVTLGTLRRLKLDLTGDGSVGIGDVRALSREQAIGIFIRHYFEAPRISWLPDCLHATMFDMYVNAGSNAVRILQQLLREMGYRVAADGIIGPQTAGASAEAAAIDAEALCNAYGVARRNYYFRLADRRPASRKYARTRAGGKGGWITRAEEFISPDYHLSRQAFQQRIAAWD
ncbi:holin-associated N-acetylmuramidase [Leisingera thetidis]|uniref:holin-associated N-acetylmuramidase n=1 Tax=Leisingera thetidis TaxID=2930199 RepID=UPI0021F78472|nr:holin-associated N-acetylmuramidase [Leisingera thetidis]